MVRTGVFAPKERKRVDAMLESFYATLADPKMEALLASYELIEPGERLNELHSLLPTEYERLSPALERYYRRYFGDRRKIVTAFESYDRVFTDLEARHDALETQLDGLHAQLDASKTELDAAGAQADDLSAQIESLRRAGSNREVELARRRAEQRRRTRQTRLAQQYNTLVDQYNGVVGQVNTVAQSAHEIYDSVSSGPEPAELVASRPHCRPECRLAHTPSVGSTTARGDLESAYCACRDQR